MIYKGLEITRVLSQEFAGEFKAGEPWPGQRLAELAFRFMKPEEILEEKAPADMENPINKDHPQGFDISKASHPFAIEKSGYFERQCLGGFFS